MILDDNTSRLIAIHDALGRIESTLDRVVLDASEQDKRIVSLEKWRNYLSGAVGVLAVWLERTNLGHILSVFH